MQWVLLAAVVAGFAAIAFRLGRDWVRLAPVRHVVKGERIVYRTPVSAQWGRGWWGRGNAKGMQLVVHERSFELSYPFPGGGLLSTEWYCRGNDARMKLGTGNFLPPAVKRDCILLSIPAIDDQAKQQEIALASRPTRRDLRSAWEALAACGVEPSSDGPAIGT